MSKLRGVVAVTGGALCVLAVALSPAFAASDGRGNRPRVSLNARGSLGSFTPASGDARLAAVIARSNLSASGFRFTPAVASVRLNRSVTVAVRARTGGIAGVNERTALVATPAQVGIAPIAYNLGVAVGWKRFALSGDVAKAENGLLGGREAVDLGVSYSTRKWSARVGAGADRPVGSLPRTMAEAPGYSVNLGGSYALTRNLDVTAGVRYRAERDRLLPLADTRRDSQAVYVGTAFKF